MVLHIFKISTFSKREPIGVDLSANYLMEHFFFLVLNCESRVAHPVNTHPHSRKENRCVNTPISIASKVLCDPVETVGSSILICPSSVFVSERRLRSRLQSWRSHYHLHFHPLAERLLSLIIRGVVPSSPYPPIYPNQLRPG
jgi:hypothetical protein